jgi:hypothetical protein
MPARQRLCERCSAEIPAERVEALPDTRVCVKCSQEIGGEFEVTLVRENLGKAGSLKKNYGGIGFKKQRRPLRPKEE